MRASLNWYALQAWIRLRLLSVQIYAMWCLLEILATMSSTRQIYAVPIFLIRSA